MVLFLAGQSAVFGQDGAARAVPDSAEAQSSQAEGQQYQLPDESLLLFQDSGQVADDEALSPSPAFGIMDLVRMVLILGAVLAAIYGLFWLIRKRRGVQSPRNSLIKIKDQLTLGGTRSIYLLELGERVFMVGATDNSLSLLTEIEDSETLNGIRVESARQGAVSGESFSSMLSSLLKKTGLAKGNLKDASTAGPSGEEGDPAFVPGEEQLALDFMKAQRERLKKW